MKASSESLTHAAIYECNSEYRAVLHVHALMPWKNLLNHIPTTSGETEYGTIGMANEIARLMRETALHEFRAIAMAGHPGGLIAFGRNLGEAFDALMKILKSA